LKLTVKIVDLTFLSPDSSLVISPSLIALAGMIKYE
jgi:hypothetical protein